MGVRAKIEKELFKLSDSGGLYLQVTTTGGKRWRWKYRVAGIEKCLSFGTYPDVPLKAAREKRDAARRQDSFCRVSPKLARNNR